MAIGKLDIEPVACRHLRDGPPTAALAIAHQCKASPQHSVIAERGEQLGRTFQTPPLARQTMQKALPQPPRQGIHLLARSYQPLAQDLQAEPRPGALEPGPARRRQTLQ